MIVERLVYEKPMTELTSCAITEINIGHYKKCI